MIVVLTGENYFAVKTALGDIVGLFLAEQGEMGLERLDGDEADFDRISQALTSLPFLASKKMVVFKNPSGNKDFAEKFEKLLDNLPETTELVLVESKLDKRTGLYKYLKKAGDFREFNRLNGRELASWLVGRASDNNSKLSLADASFLVERVGENQQMLAGELDKLLLHGEAITRSDIELLVEKTSQSKIFDMLDAVFAGDGGRALELYREQRAMQVAPQEIIAMLGWQLKILAIIKSSDGRSPRDVAADFGMGPYAVQKSWRTAQAMTLARIKKSIHELAALDVRLKSETVDADAALGQYLLGLTT